jgi:hypothetical protein
VLIAEGGAAWAPFLGDRMNEGYRQHGVTAVPSLTGMGAFLDLFPHIGEPPNDDEELF